MRLSRESAGVGGGVESWGGTGAAGCACRREVGVSSVKGRTSRPEVRDLLQLNKMINVGVPVRRWLDDSIGRGGNNRESNAFAYHLRTQ